MSLKCKLGWHDWHEMFFLKKKESLKIFNYCGRCNKHGEKKEYTPISRQEKQVLKMLRVMLEEEIVKDPHSFEDCLLPTMSGKYTVIDFKSYKKPKKRRQK